MPGGGVGQHVAHHLGGIGGCTENPANFGNIFNTAEYVDRIPIAHGDHEHVTGPQCRRIANGERFEIGVITVGPREAGAGSFVEGDAKLHLRDGIDDGLVDVFDGLDEVSLSEDQVSVLGNFERNQMEVEHKKMRLRRAVTGTPRRRGGP